MIARTALLMSALIALLGIGGWAFGGTTGLVVMIVIGLAIDFGSYWFSDKLALRANGARPVTRAEAPALYEIIERLARGDGLAMPTVHVIPSPSPNAFATGRGPQHAAVAVTEGLLAIASPRELEGVLAHELSHVKDRDVLIATIAAGIAGTISTIGYIMQWGLMLGGGRGDDDRRGSPVVAIAWIVVAPIVALLLQLAISRSREYGADAAGARLTNDPDALANALEKIEAVAERRPYERAGPATAHLFLVNPLRGHGSILSLLSTHPPTEERVARLRAMARR